MQAIQVDEISTLIDRARQGSPGAADELARRFHKPLVGFVLSRINCPREDAEDLIQEVWARVFMELHKSAEDGGYDHEKGTFYTFVINRYAKFQLMQYLDRNRKRSVDSFAADDGDGESHVDPQIAADDPDPEMALVIEEDRNSRTALLEECFRLTFRYGGYPHQVLAFGYSKLIYGQTTRREGESSGGGGRKRRREIEGDPKRLDADHGTDPLANLIDSFWEEYVRRSSLLPAAQARLDAYLEPTRERLVMTIAELAKDNKVFRDHHERLLATLVGDTNVQSYYGTRGVNAITDWCDKVQNRVREKLGLK